MNEMMKRRNFFTSLLEIKFNPISWIRIAMFDLQLLAV